MAAPTPSGGDVESLIEALQPILAKCEQYDRKENTWSKRYSEGFTVGISLGTCRRIRAAITSHDTSILLRRALENAEAEIDRREREMIAERKAQYGDRFNNEQLACIEGLHRSYRIGVKIVREHIAALKEGAE
jgi:hypothetical protein